jgi:Transposase
MINPFDTHKLFLTLFTASGFHIDTATNGVWILRAESARKRTPEKSVTEKFRPGTTSVITRWDEKAGLPRDAIRSPMFDVLDGTIKRRPAMQKISTMQTNGKSIFEGQLTIGLDLGDRSSAYCVLNEAGEIVSEQKLATTPGAMKHVFGSMPRCRIAMETGTHSPWVSRLLSVLRHEVIVGHAQKVRLITKSRRKDDRLDARTLARLARIDAELLSPVKHRNAEAQLHLTEIRARAGLVSARTALVNAARGLVKSYGERLRKCGTQQFRQELPRTFSVLRVDSTSPRSTYK